jgi:hypothetical protein
MLMGVFKDMVTYYTPLMGTFKSMVGLNTSQFLGGSLLSAVSLEAIAVFLRLDFLGVTVGMIVTVGFFILMDWWTGSAASHTKAITARNKGDEAGYQEHKIKSTKISFTIFKFISLYLWLVLSHSVYDMAIENGFVSRASSTIEATGFHTVLRIFAVVPIILFGFREFISIGENIKGIYGKTPYLFTLGEKIFETLQFNFLTRLKTADPTIKQDDTVS